MTGEEIATNDQVTSIRVEFCEASLCPIEEGWHISQSSIDDYRRDLNNFLLDEYPLAEIEVV